MAGHTLDTGSLRRSLNTQTDLFAGNWSVALLGADLLRRAEAEVARRSYPDQPTHDAAGTLRTFLRNVRLDAVDNPSTAAVESVRSPTNATPGLSSHGRLSAVDFVVKQGRRVIAGASTAQIRTWRRVLATGMSFDRALQTAVAGVNRTAGGPFFEGPLPAPDEPWHYTYLPIQQMENDEDRAASDTEAATTTGSLISGAAAGLASAAAGLGGAIAGAVGTALGQRQR
jgi:hypothetical protein